jgi:5-methylcytosine-specific restriction endonuclease McrA
MKSLSELRNELEEIKKKSDIAISAIEDANQQWENECSPRVLYRHLKSLGIYDQWIQEQIKVQNNRCFNKKCQCLFSDDNPFTIDHVEPLSPKKIPGNPDKLWGYTSNTTNNFILLCDTCNKVKSNRTDIDIWAGWNKADIKRLRQNSQRNSQKLGGNHGAG